MLVVHMSIMVVYLQRYGTLMFYPGEIANILYMYRIVQYYHLWYNTNPNWNFIVRKDDGST